MEKSNKIGVIDYPLVSIVVPSYNHALYIQECIESIVLQDYPNFELIVIDDGSMDKSSEILKGLQAKYDFTLEINKNKGLSKTLNRGFRDLAKGVYFTFCASDDKWFPGKLRKQVEFLEENPDFAMVYGKAWYIDENGKDVHDRNKKSASYLGGSIFEDLFLQKFHPPVNYMLRASVVSGLGFYREHIWAEDFDMNLRIAENHPIGYLDEYLSYYRVFLNGESKMLNFKTMHSHKDSIDLFKHRPEYAEAILNWRYKNFRCYAPFKATKWIAFKFMILSISKINRKDFWKSFAVFLLRWH